MKSYTLAIIIPAWNSAIYIREMLDSLLSNDFMDWHCFVVDDGSTDETPIIVKEIESKDNRIHFIRRNREPKGAPTCRNTGFLLSEGAKYVIWFDADDVVTPYCLSQRVNFMESHPELDFGVFLAKEFHQDFWEKDGCQIFGFRYPVDDLCRFLRRTIPFVVWTNIYRRDSLLKHQLLWDERLLSQQDSDFNIQAILRGMKYEYAEREGCKVDYFWRVDNNKQNISSKIWTQAHIESHLHFIKKTYSSLSRSQRRNMWIEIEAMFFFFVDKFLYNRYFLSRLFISRFVLEHPIFALKLLVYCKTKKHKARLFPKTTKYIQMFYSVYWDEQKTLIDQVCNSLSPLKYPKFTEESYYLG